MREIVERCVILAVMLKSVRRFRLAVCCALALGGLLGGSLFAEIESQPPLKVALIGDSTVSAYPPGSQIRGWGEFLQPSLRSRVHVSNRAVPGTSSKTFAQQGRWRSVLAEHPAILLIQFGINDQGQKIDAKTEFKTNLHYYISDARLANTTPILVTPICFRSFDPAGNLTDNLKPYVDVIKQVGAEEQVPVIDLHASCAELYTKLGAARSSQLANKRGDFVHFNKLGAMAMAELVLRDLPDAEPRLRREIIQHFSP